MQQFIVPQFIDVENKIIGPISARQFIIILVAGVLTFISYKLLSFWAFIFAAIILLGLAVVFAFVKINGQMFHFFALNLIQTLKRPRLRVWRKDMDKERIRQEVEAKVKILAPKKLVSSSHLAELSLRADLGGIYNDDQNK